MESTAASGRILPARRAAWAGADLSLLPLWVWAIVATLAVAGLALLTGSFPVANGFGDSDDATRMLEVRELLSGAPWFDTTLARFGGTEPLISHWSRLVDLPIALLVVVFRLFAAPETAELAARVVWPLALLGLLFWVLAESAAARGGRSAGLITLFLGALCLSGTVQFLPGRIDHHNVMILSAVGGTLLLARSIVQPRLGLAAGFLLGLGTVVGYEALLLTMGTLVVAGALAVWDGTGRPGTGRAAIGFSFALFSGFVLTVPPQHWYAIHCDALSVNLVLPVSAAAAGFVATLYTRPRRSREVRLAALAATGITAFALFTILEPACLAGPFAEVDPAVWPIWLDRVRETHGLGWFAATLPLPAATYVLHVMLGAVASIAILRRDGDRRALFLAMVTVLWVAMSAWQVKLMPYAAMLVLPALGVAIARLEGSASLSPDFTRLAAALLLNQQALLIMGALIFGTGAAAAQKFAAGAAAKRSCIASAAVAPLASLPKGLAVSDVDLGPFLVAGTALDAFAAPYHRLDRQIIETHAIFAAGAEEANHRLRRAGARYVVLCEAPDAAERETAPAPESLRVLLRNGTPPGFLEPVPLAEPTPLRVWRVR